MLPLLGGFIADRFLGNYRTIVYFSIPYVIGQGILGFKSLHNTPCLFLSLGLLVLGSRDHQAQHLHADGLDL